MESQIIVIVVASLIAILIFLVCREIVCWYFKINKAVDLMSEQNKILNKILKELEENS